MKLENIDFGIGFDDKIVMGEKSKKAGVFKNTPIDITNKAVMFVAEHIYYRNMGYHVSFPDKDGKIVIATLNLKLEETTKENLNKYFSKEQSHE